MKHCKVCSLIMENSHHLAVTCSPECQKKNFQRIKREHYERSRQTVIDKASEWRKQNPEKYAESRKSLNPEKIANSKRKYAEKNKEKIRAKSTEYNNSPERKLYMKEYRLKPTNNKKEKERGQAYYRRHPEREKNAHLKRKFGITLEKYQQMLDSQNGVCAICGESEKRINRVTGTVTGLSVDHCHKTGKVRGLLCFKCNASIGKFNDCPDMLRKAASYLDSYT